MQPVNSGIAYLLWSLCFVGVCGGQRFYTGKVTSGLIYLFTFGVFG
ncbi:MAG: NINE protein, partial [Nodosilinea sp.]